MYTPSNKFIYAFTTVLSELPLSWEYCITQTNNRNRFIRLKFYYIFTLPKIHILLSTSLCCKYYQIVVSLNSHPFIHTTRYFIRCLTKRSRKCLTKEVNLHICLYIKHHNSVLICYFYLICYVILCWHFTPVLLNNHLHTLNSLVSIL